MQPCQRGSPARRIAGLDDKRTWGSGVGRAEWERTIAARASVQHGVVTRAQVLEAGGSDRIIANRLATGQWRRACPGVYLLAGAPNTWNRSLTVEVLARVGGLASHASAARLHGLGRFHRTDGFEVTAGRAASGRGRNVMYHQTRLMSVACTVSGIPATTPTRTVVDLAGRLDSGELERLVDDGVAAGVLRIGALRDAVVARGPHRGRVGITNLRMMLAVRADDAWQPSESELERMLAGVLDRPTIPPWTAQAPAPWEPGGRCRVDALIPSWAMVVEADGRRWHTRVRDFERDRRRDHAATAAGLVTLRFGWEELSSETEYVESVLVEAGQRRMA